MEEADRVSLANLWVADAVENDQFKIAARSDTY
jgi:hypothetical protein